MKKLMMIMFAMFGSTLLLAGCETLEGAGEDIETVGESVQNAAEHDHE